MAKHCPKTRDTYSLHYTTSPGKSYRIEPDRNRELNYAKAYKDPLAFYDDVMNEQVTQHKAKDLSSPVGKNGRQKIEFTTKRTFRKVGKILMMVQDQFIDFLKGNWSVHQLKAAMKDKNVQKSIERNMKDGGIILLHRDSKEQVFKKQTTLIGEKGAEEAEAVEEEINDDEHIDTNDAEVVSILPI